MSPIGLAEQLHRLGRRADVQSFNGFNRQQIEVAGDQPARLGCDRRMHKGIVIRVTAEFPTGQLRLTCSLSCLVVTP